MKKLIVGIIVLLLLVGFGIYWISDSRQGGIEEVETDQQVGTTTEEDISTPAPQPGESKPPASGEVALKVGQPVTMYGVTATAVEVLEDSRCPQGVQCIRAGTVRVRINFITPLGNTSQVFELNKTITLAGYTIVMNRVVPEAQVGRQISDSEYVFYFTASK